MKKRFLLPLVGTGLFTVLGVAGQQMIESNINACNHGDIDACSGLVDLRQETRDRVTNPAFKQLVADAEAAKAKANQPSAEQALYNLQVKIETAAMNCEKAIKPTLKDPRSFRKVSHDLVDISDGNLTVSVSYIATNSFGGPARGAQSCSYAM
jgi:hypothetical protein